MKKRRLPINSREAVLSEYIDKQTPSANALAHIKKEIQELWD